MKKFAKIAAITAFIPIFAGLCACSFTGESPSAPSVEIVERSDLLNRINVDSVIDKKTEMDLSELGFSADMVNVFLTSDYTAKFDLVLTDGQGRKSVFSLPAYLSYGRSASGTQESFENIKVYRGKIKTGADGLTVIGADRVFHLSAENSDLLMPNISREIWNSGCITDAAYDKDLGFGVVFRKDSCDYLAVYNTDGEQVNFTKIGENAVAMPSSDTLPFDIENKPTAEFLQGNLIISTADTAYCYMTAENMLLCGEKRLVKAENNGEEFALYRLSPHASSKGKLHKTMYMAVKNIGDDVGCVVFDGNMLGMSLGDVEFDTSNAVPVLKCARTGVELDLDFVIGEVSGARYKIPREILGDKLYTSKNKAYSLYTFAPEKHGEVLTYNFALKENSTGKTGYLGCGGLINGAYPGEAGFLSDGMVYVLGNNDYRIYSVDVDNTAALFSLSDCMVLGEDIDKEGTDRVLAAVLPKEDCIIAVYYDTVYETGEDIFLDENRDRLKAVYKAAVLDKNGNVSAEYDTGLNALYGYCPVTIYKSKNKLYLYVTYKDTGAVLAKGTLNLANGSFVLTKEYERVK